MDTSRSFSELALFAGAGLGLLGTHSIGARLVCAVEWDAYAADVLAARMRDGWLDAAPIWDDVRTFDGRPWRGRVDMVSAGFPCQPFSLAGKQAAADDARNGWPSTARIASEVRPQVLWLENVPGLLTGRHGYVRRVYGDLAALGYDAVWIVVGAKDAGAPHKRDRLFILALDSYTDRRRLAQFAQSYGEQRGGLTEHEQGDDPLRLRDDVPNTHVKGLERLRNSIGGATKHAVASLAGGWQVEPDVGRVVDGCPRRVDRIRCLGNGQVPQQVILAWFELWSRAKQQGLF